MLLPLHPSFYAGDGDEASTSCKSCLPGMYSQSNAIACFNCAKGSFQPVQNSSSCQQCDLGLYQPRTGEPQCQMCPTGYATNSTESVKCSPCVEGRFASNQGASLCGKCPVGWSGPLPQQPECVVCLPGEAQKNSGFPACQDCQAGFFSASQGADRCVACQAGTYQEMAIETRCLDCPSGFTATEASRVCSPMPDSKDVLPPRLILAKVIFTEEKVLTGVNLNSPANATTLRLVVERPFSANSTVGVNKGQMVHVMRTHVQWSSRRDFSNQVEIGRFVNTQARSSSRYSAMLLELPKSLYTPSYQIYIRTASYLSDTSWTVWKESSVLPCSSLLGAGTAPDLPCPVHRQDNSLVEPEPAITSIRYHVLHSDEVYQASVFSRELPVLKEITVQFTVPEFSTRLFKEDLLDNQNLRAIKANCLFSQIEWSPDKDFSRLRVGARVSCTSPSPSVVVSNFDSQLEFGGTVFTYPGISGQLYFRVRTYLDDTSSTKHVLPSTIFPLPLTRGIENAGPVVYDNRIVDENTMIFFLKTPEVNTPDADILFLELQFSTQREFRETAKVTYNHSVIISTTGVKRTTTTSDRVRIIIDSNGGLAVKIEFNQKETGSLYVQKYFVRVSAVYDDGSIILQDRTYDFWSAFARGCNPVTATYLQTHWNNDIEQPFRRVQDLRCQPCPLGASCSGDFVTFNDIVARSGFRRLSWNQSIFGACPVKHACLGVPDILDPNTKEVLSVKPLEFGDKKKFEMCRSGHLNTSELCSDCTTNYLVKLTANPPGTCSKCPPGGQNFAIFALMIAVALGYMGFLIVDALQGAKLMIEESQVRVSNII